MFNASITPLFSCPAVSFPEMPELIHYFSHGVVWIVRRQQSREYFFDPTLGELFPQVWSQAPSVTTLIKLGADQVPVVTVAARLITLRGRELFLPDSCHHRSYSLPVAVEFPRPVMDSDLGLISPQVVEGGLVRQSAQGMTAQLHIARLLDI